MRNSLFCFAVAVGCVPMAMAQIQYDPNIGLPQGAGDDTITSLSLPFAFRFPDGLVVNAIDVDSNGRVLWPGGDTSEFIPSISDLLTENSSLNPFWLDVDFTQANSDDIYFSATPTKAVITFVDAVLWGAASAPFTYQVQLFSDNRFAFVYDGRMPLDLPLVGVSQGGGATDPGQTDLSAALAAPIVTSNTTVYEDFLFTTNFDLAGNAFEFIPSGTGWTIVASSAGVAVADEFGRSCRSTLQYLPDGSGGYIVARCTSGCFQSNFGTSIGITQDDEMNGPHALGFTFTMPGGATTTAVDVDSNGRLVLPATTGSIFSPFPADLLNDTTPSIAPLWTDFDITQPAVAGDILLATGPGFATFTWSNIALFGGSEPLTMQVTLRSDNSITFAYSDTTNWDFQLVGDAIVGVSPGNGAVDPGEVDFLTLPVIGGSTIYQYTDGFGGDRLDLQVSLRALSLPALGANFDLRIDGIPSSAVAASLLFGTSNPALDLDLVPSLGLPGCSLLTDASLVTTPVAFAGPGSSSISTLPISNSIALLGFPLVIQSALIAPGETPLGVVLGTAVNAVVGL